MSSFSVEEPRESKTFWPKSAMYDTHLVSMAALVSLGRVRYHLTTLAP